MKNTTRLRYTPELKTLPFSPKKLIYLENNNSAATE